ncbi:MAG: hydroxyisourate hydrolase [Polyangiaceae bacterium]
MSAITTHVLDTSLGKPAAGVPIKLELRNEEGSWEPCGHGVTDNDGRLRDLLKDTPLSLGTYRISFDTYAYFTKIAVEHFYPEVSIVFVVRDVAAHFHVPLLLSPFGFSSYRGS